MSGQRRVFARALASTYCKILFAGIVAFIGIAGGIYVGYNVLGLGPHGSRGQQVDLAGLQNALETSGYGVDFGPGELFPLEDYQEIDGRRGNFEQLLHGQTSLVVLMSVRCSACMDFLTHWDRLLASRLRSPLQLVICLDYSDSTRVNELFGVSLDDKRLVYCDRKIFGDKYNVKIEPVLVGVDQYGLIRNIQLGYRGVIDKGFLEFLDIAPAW